MLSNAMPMLSPVLARRKCCPSSPYQDPSPPCQITNENRGIFGGVSTLKWDQNGSVLKENGTFFGKFWIDPNKIRTFDRSNQKLARFFMLDSWHTRLFEQEHTRNTARIFRKSERRFWTQGDSTAPDRTSERKMLATRIEDWAKR